MCRFRPGSNQDGGAGAPAAGHPSTSNQDATEPAEQQQGDVSSSSNGGRSRQQEAASAAPMAPQLVGGDDTSVTTAAPRHPARHWLTVAGGPRRRDTAGGREAPLSPPSLQQSLERSRQLQGSGSGGGASPGGSNGSSKAQLDARGDEGQRQSEVDQLSWGGRMLRMLTRQLPFVNRHKQPEQATDEGEAAAAAAPVPSKPSPTNQQPAPQLGRQQAAAADDYRGRRHDSSHRSERRPDPPRRRPAPIIGCGPTPLSELSALSARQRAVARRLRGCHLKDPVQLLLQLPRMAAAQGQMWAAQAALWRPLEVRGGGGGGHHFKPNHQIRTHDDIRT